MLNVKTTPLLSLYFRFSTPLIFKWLYFALYGVFYGDLGFYYRYPHPDSPFLSFLCW